MKQLKTFLLLCAITFSYVSVLAQAIHFSQFYMSPLNLHPALTGVMNSQVRVVGNYRNQWASGLKSNAFSTYSASYDQKIPVGRYDYFGVGGTFWGDKAGQLDFKTLQAKVSASYSKRMGGYRSKSHYLVVGVEGGIAQRSIDFTRAQWASQHDGEGGFNGNLNSGEEFANDNFYSFELGEGINWSATFENGNTFNLGSSFAHLNRANQSFDPISDLPLYSKFGLHGKATLKIAPKVNLTPRIMSWRQGPSFELNGGTGIQLILKEETLNAIELGIATRLANSAAPYDPNNVGNTDVTIWTDALIFNLNYIHQKFVIGLSYDLNVSDLKQASNGNGADELAVV
mgnify:CR=1 FL=1